MGTRIISMMVVLEKKIKSGNSMMVVIENFQKRNSSFS
jgi:hypothetical protein